MIKSETLLKTLSRIIEKKQRLSDHPVIHEVFKTSFAKVFTFCCNHLSVCVIFRLVIQVNIEAQYIFPASLYTIKHLLLNRYRGVFSTQSNI